MGTPWKAPRLWPGETVVVMATGESLTQAQADYARGKARVIAVNDAWKRAPWADLFFAADAKWWHAYYQHVAKLGGLMLCAQEDVTFPAVHVIGHDREGKRRGFDDPGFVQGNNSGAEALHLAWHMAGAARKILLGCDCTGTHFFGEHPPALRQAGAKAESYAWGFQHVGAALAKRQVEVINCSAVSILTCFPKARLEDVL